MSDTIYDKEVALKEYSASVKDLQLAKKFNKSSVINNLQLLNASYRFIQRAP